MKINNNRKKKLLLIDIIIYAAVYITTAVIMCFSSHGQSIDQLKYISNALILFSGIILVRMMVGVYKNVWRYANSRAYLEIVLSDFLGGLMGLMVTYLLVYPYIGIWQSASIVAMVDIVTLSSRFIYQQHYRHMNVGLDKLNKIGVAIVGAGHIGAMLADELKYNSSSHYHPYCFIDSDPDKIGSKICGIKVFSEKENIVEIIKGMPIQEIFIAIPNLDGETANRMHSFYSRTGCKVKIYDFPLKDTAESDQSSRRVIREFHIEDLLFRDSIKIDNKNTTVFFKDKVILVTGGGGSIGSEICRHIAMCEPRKLVIFDIYENNAYEIEQELIRRYQGTLNLAVEIGSVRDRARLESIFDLYRPDIVFHAAAHKHVPLMEHSVCEAIKNNVFGTMNTADMAEKYGVQKFILISTDKAVNPTNVMGASKRMCEMVIQCRSDSSTSFAAVRFGNVLGSNGSVINLFKKQIANGGPVTITDKRIIRYFMTIPEAASLVIEAGIMAKSGELFVLNMGKPVKIIDLAQNMIKLSGFKPYEDIDIIEIGLRPGEKLYEELLMKSETLMKTDNDMIFIEYDTPLTRREVMNKLSVLRRAVEKHESEGKTAPIISAIKSVVPTYHDPDSVNSAATSAEEMKITNSLQTKNAVAV